MGIKDFFSGAGKVVGGQLGKASEALRGRQAQVATDIGQATSDALGDNSLRAQAQAKAAANAQAEMTANAAKTSRAPFMGSAPQPIPEPARGWIGRANPMEATGGIGADAVRASERVSGAPLRQAGIQMATPAEQAAAKTGIMSKAGSFLRGAGYVGAGLAAADAADKASAGQTSDQVAGRAGPVMGGLREFHDTLTFGQGRRMSDAMIEGGAALFDTPQTPGIGGRLRNAFSAAGKAWNKTDAEEKAAGQPKAAPVKPVAKPPLNNTTMSGTIGGNPPPLDYYKDKPSPATVLRSNAVPASGTGVFQRSGGEAVAVGTPDGTNRVGDDGTSLRSGPVSMATALGGLARANRQDLDARRQRAEGRADTELGIKAATAGRAARAADQTYEIAGKKQLEDRVAAHVEASIPPADDTIFSGAGTKRKNQVEQRKQEIMNRMESSAAQRKDGRRLGQLSPTEREQLVIGNQILEKTKAARSTWTQSMRDFFGNKRVDTNNIYSAMPVKAVKATLPGSYVIHMGNGNTVEVKELAGGFVNILSPNEPIDADIMELIQPHINAAKKASK